MKNSISMNPDSPHNFALLKEMPSYYACPSDMELKPGMTGYVAVIGAATCFRPDFQAVRIQDITDGTSNTLLIGESRESVPWTKPDDLPFDINITVRPRRLSTAITSAVSTPFSPTVMSTSSSERSIPTSSAR